jgi:hypothetical protein
MTLDPSEKAAIVSEVEAAIVAKARANGAPLVLSVERFEEKKLDSYRPVLQFLAGLLAFCLTLIVALIAGLDPDNDYAINSLLSLVLIGISITAALATIAIGLLQWAKSRRAGDATKGRVLTWLGGFGGVLAVVLGVVTVAACVYGASGILQRHCVGVPGDMAIDAFSALVKTERPHDAQEYAQARAHDCFDDGDLASSAAWAIIAATLGK